MLSTPLQAFTASHPPDAVWLLAVSGGQDSVALVEACHQAGIRFAVAHVNYHLRGDDSLLDEQLVARLAGKAQVPCHFFSAPITEKAGLQAHARRVRYHFFADLCRTYGYYGTLLAHHAQDQAETVLFNLLRGTGLKGLAAMQPWDKRRKIGRPFLSVSKDEIRKFAYKNHLHWREDISNDTDAYMRNRIRHHVLPVLQQVYPGWQKNILKTAEHAAEAWKCLQDNDLLISNIENPSSLALDGSNTFSLAGKIQGAFKGLKYTHALRLAKAHLNKNQEDQKLETAAGIFEIKEGILHFAPAPPKATGSKKTIAAEPPTITLTPGTTAPASLEAIRAQAAQGIFYLSEAACPPPYTLRPPREGDRIQPLGLKGTKLISDLRQEKGLPRTATRDLRVLVREDGTILWVSLGVVAEVARIQPGEKALKLNMI